MCKRILPGGATFVFSDRDDCRSVRRWSLDSVLCPRGPLNFSHTSLLQRTSPHIVSQSMTDASNTSRGILRERDVGISCQSNTWLCCLKVLKKHGFLRVVPRTAFQRLGALIRGPVLFTLRCTEPRCDKAHCPVSLSETHSAALQHLCHKLHSVQMLFFESNLRRSGSVFLSPFFHDRRVDVVRTKG